jgi:hypothetical protein
LLAAQPPRLAPVLQAAACTYHVAFGPRAGHKVLAVQDPMTGDNGFERAPCTDMSCFCRHAALRCGADVREAMEQRCRHITGRALADECVRGNAVGHVPFKLKTAQAQAQHVRR